MGDAVLRLKRGRDRARVHPWIFKGDVADVTAAEAGGAVSVVDSAGRFLGRGFYNPGPALCCRVATRLDEPLDEAFLVRRLATALALRSSHGPPTLTRLAWSEADGVPGLVVDRYGPVLVVQCLTLGMARCRDAAARALRHVVGDLPIFNRDDPGAARVEGFTPAAGWLDRPGPGHVVVEEGPARFGVTVGTGHKTGLYLDQRDNRARVAELARDRDVLDAFAYTAGFACHALLGGARRALCLESSPEALAGARANLELNGLTQRSELRGGNAFDELRRLERERARFGLVVLDPPPFARSRAALGAALRGYKEVNLRAMRLLEPKGHLLTFSCSHHVTDALFEEVCREAAADVGVALRVRSRLTQAPDHPVLLAVPETRYLKGLLLELV
jgi:23S rRNA (cytosine1962-C5)-methyltransferase